jgi:GTP-binding protein
MTTRKEAPKSSRVKPPSFRHGKTATGGRRQLGRDKPSPNPKSAAGKAAAEGKKGRGFVDKNEAGKTSRAKAERAPNPKRAAPRSAIKAREKKAAAKSGAARGSAAVATSAPRRRQISTAALPKAQLLDAGEAGEEVALPPAPEKRVRYEGLPLIVIAGRPNVGKSTLFNRLLHKKRAITDPTPGVTRDPVESVCEFRGADKRARLLDTGGFKLEREGLDALVVEKSLSSIERADLILFLVDVTEITPEDEEFAALLRRYSDKVILVVNKADSPERDALVFGHLRWGFKPMLFISAEHNRNIDSLEEAIVPRLDFSKAREVEYSHDEIRVAIMGKPNTGKSTLLNRLIGEEKSIVSPVAGTTRDVVEAAFEYKKRRIVLLDTAGIRRKKKVTDNVEYYSVNRAIKTVDECDVVILMIDAQEGLTDQDKKITAFAVEQGRGVIFVLNKWDEMPDLKNSFEAARDKLRYFFGQVSYAPVLPLSAKNGTGVDKLLNTLVSVHAELCHEIETSALNKAVSAWIEETPPPVGTKTHFKLRYALQTSVNPLRFVFFVTRPDAVREAYIAFLRNKIRDELGFDKVPLTVELRASRGDAKRKR